MGATWIWVTLAILVVAGIGWYFYDRTAKSRYHPIGDELLDRYAAEFLKDLQRNLKSPNSGNTATQVPDRFDKRSALLLESWEDEYRDDPHYWQLRAQATPNGANEQALAGLGDPLTVTKLPDLIAAGMTDEGIFALVGYRKLFESDPARALELIHQAVELHRDNAHFHYLQATLELKSGNPQAAWEAISRGNSSPRNDPPAIYPVCPDCVDPELFRSSKANRAFYMTWITNYQVFNEFLNYQLLKDFVNLALEKYPERLDPGFLDQLLQMAYRNTQRSDKPNMSISLSYWIVDQLVNSEPVMRLAEKSGRDQERQDLLDSAKSAHKRRQQRLRETIAQGDVAAFAGEENWDKEFERHLENDTFLDTEIYPLLEPLGEPVFTRWAEEAGLDPSQPVL